MSDATTQQARAAHRIRVALVECGMDQKDLAAAAGIDRVTLNRYLRGHVSMNMGTFIRVADALGVTPSDLLR